MVLLTSQFKSSLAAVAGSVALFTHCQVIQLSAMTDFVVLNRRIQAKIKNRKFLLTDEAKITFYTAHLHACMHEFLGRVLTTLLAV